MSKGVCPEHGPMMLIDCQCCGGMGEREYEDEFEYVSRCPACNGTGDDFVCEICHSEALEDL